MCSSTKNNKKEKKKNHTFSTTPPPKRKQKDLPSLWIGKISIMTMNILPKTMYRFNTFNTIKIPFNIIYRLENRKKNPKIYSAS